jgi:CRP/FNR family transcriptional regulator
MSDPTHPLSAIPLFAGLEPVVLDELLAASRVRHFPKGQILCSEGDPGDDLLLLEEGRVRVCRYGAGGREVVLADVDAPHAFGEISLIDHLPRTATLIAVTRIRVRFVPRQPVIRLAERNPEVAMALLRGLAAMVRTSNDRLADMLVLDVPARLAKWLLAQAGDDDRLVLAESQESLGIKLGTTRVTVNRTLHRFARGGLIRIDGSAIELVDRRALASLGEG